MEDGKRKRIHTQILSLLMDLNLNDRVHVALTDKNPRTIPGNDIHKAFSLMDSMKTLDTENGFLAVYIPSALDVHFRPFLFALSAKTIDEITTARDKTGGLKSFTVHFSGNGKLTVDIPDSVFLDLPGEKRKTHFFH